MVDVRLPNGTGVQVASATVRGGPVTSFGAAGAASEAAAPSEPLDEPTTLRATREALLAAQPVPSHAQGSKWRVRRKAARETLGSGFAAAPTLAAARR
jgi:hypothetical protein